MTNQKNTPEKVAEALEESGLFTLSLNSTGLNHSRMDKSYYTTENAKLVAKLHGDNYVGPYPTADQSEEILGKMGLQVVWDDYTEEWNMVRLGLVGDEDVYCKYEYHFLEIPKGARTHANNAGLAYCCENMLEELKLVMEGE